MGAPIYSASDYLNALLSLMPRGRVWPKDLSSVQAATLACFAPTFVRSNESAAALLVDAFPATTDAMLPEWESTLGLPDPCAGELPTLQQRVTQVVARFANTGGQSIAFFTAYAAQLGFTVQITQYTPFRMGQQRMGNQLGGPEWAFTWSINAPFDQLTSFRMGLSAMGDALESWDNDVLECEINTIKPAHTIALFTYGLGELNSTFVLDESTLG